MGTISSSSKKTVAGLPLWAVRQQMERICSRSFSSNGRKITSGDFEVISKLQEYNKSEEKPVIDKG
jgi:hypothetical protein